MNFVCKIPHKETTTTNNVLLIPNTLVSDIWYTIIMKCHINSSHVLNSSFQTCPHPNIIICCGIECTELLEWLQMSQGQMLPGHILLLPDDYFTPPYFTPSWFYPNLDSTIPFTLPHLLQYPTLCLSSPCGGPYGYGWSPHVRLYL